MKRVLSVLLVVAMMVLSIPVAFSATDYAFTVLICDTSEEMQGDRLERMKDIAKTICRTVLSGDPNHYFAIVESKNTEKSFEFTNDFSILETTIDSLQANGLNNLYCGLTKADLLLSKQNSNTKNIVVLLYSIITDGPVSDYGKATDLSSNEPTQSECNIYLNPIFDLLSSGNYPDYSIYTYNCRSLFSGGPNVYIMILMQLMGELQNTVSVAGFLTETTSLSDFCDSIVGNSRASDVEFSMCQFVENYKVLDGKLYKDYVIGDDEEVNGISIYVDIKNNCSLSLASEQFKMHYFCRVFAGDWPSTSWSQDELQIDPISIGEDNSCRLLLLSKQEVLELMNESSIQIIITGGIYNNEDYYSFSFPININYSLEKATLLAGYDPDCDRYSFQNLVDTIDEEYYVNAYGKRVGKTLYKNFGGSKPKGHCFGMAATTGSYLQNSPDKKGYISFYENPLINPFELSGVNTLTVLEYIKYAHIYQYCSDSHNSTIINRGSSRVLWAVERCVKNGTPVVIDMINKETRNGHTVLAVGIDGNAIIVNDSNDPRFLHRIVVNDSSWNYSCAGLNYNSINDDISYYLDYTKIYQCLISGQKFEYSKNRLVSASSGIVLLENSSLIPIGSTDSETETLFSTNNLYWIDEPTGFLMNNTSKEEGVIQIVSEKQTFEIKLQPNSNMLFEELSEDQIVLQTSSQTAVDFSLEQDINDESKTISVSGNSNDDGALITIGDSDVIVEGLNSISVNLRDEDNSTSHNFANIQDGRTVDISINSNNEIAIQHEHDYSVTTIMPTCTEVGVITSICSICKDVQIENLGKDKTNHANNETRIVNAYEASCTASGYTGDKTCAACGETIAQGRTIDPLGHTVLDSNGNCVRCGKHIKDVPEPDSCPKCGKIHNGGFFDKLTGFFHRLIYRLTNWFQR